MAFNLPVSPSAAGGIFWATEKFVSPPCRLLSPSSCLETQHWSKWFIRQVCGSLSPPLCPSIPYKMLALLKTYFYLNLLKFFQSLSGSTAGASLAPLILAKPTAWETTGHWRGSVSVGTGTSAPGLPSSASSALSRGSQHWLLQTQKVEHFKWGYASKCSEDSSFSFFLRFYLFSFREGKGGTKRGRETSMCGCLSRAPSWGPAL